jgi:hypothetical protein
MEDDDKKTFGKVRDATRIQLKWKDVKDVKRDIVGC